MVAVAEIEACKKRGIDVLLTYIPFQAGENQYKEANRVYDIPDQRTNGSYDSWYEDYADYEDHKLTELRWCESLDNYLMLLADKNYSVVVEISNTEIWNNENYMQLFENLGVSRDNITDDIDFLVIKELGKMLIISKIYMDFRTVEKMHSGNSAYLWRNPEHMEYILIMKSSIQSRQNKIKMVIYRLP